MIKKLLAIIISIFTFCLTSCSLFVIEYEGLETFGIGSSNVGLCVGFIPDDMLSKFEYRNGNHYFLSEYELTRFEVQKVLLYLTYDSDVYINAKEYVNTELHLVERKDKTTCNYIFYDHYGYEEYYEEGRKEVKYPYYYKMVAFNDDNHTIVFFGMFLPKNSVHLKKDNAPITFDDHIKYFYSDWYDFFS